MGNGTTDGAANDAGTYIAQNRPQQGQIFTTGSYSGGYRVKAVWLKHAAYMGNGDSTYWHTANGGELTVRVTQPSSAGSSGFVLRSETVVATASKAELRTVLRRSPPPTPPPAPEFGCDFSSTFPPRCNPAPFTALMSPPRHRRFLRNPWHP